MPLEFWEEVFDEYCVREDEVDVFGVLLLAETLDEELLRLLPVFAVLAVRLLLLPLFTVFPWRLALGAEASLVAGVSFSLGMLAVSVAMVLLLLLLSSVTVLSAVTTGVSAVFSVAEGLLPPRMIIPMNIKIIPIAAAPPLM